MQINEQGMNPSGLLMGMLCQAGKVAMDSYAVFQHGHYVMQSKGSQFGVTPHHTIRQSEVATVLRRLTKKVPGALALEFLSLKSAPSHNQGASLHSLLNDEKIVFLFICKDTLSTAVHPYFTSITSQAPLSTEQEDTHLPEDDARHVQNALFLIATS